MNKKLEIFIAIIFGLFVIIIIASLSDTEEAVRKVKEQNVVSYSNDKVELINELIEDVGNSMTATVWDKDQNFIVKDNDNYPYEIIVNVSYNSSIDCLYAKEYLRDIAHTIYTNPSLKGKISRILFTTPNIFKASLGYNDFKDFKETNWDYMGPTVFWRGVLDYCSYENEYGNLANRTWGVSFDSSCK